MWAENNPQLVVDFAAKLGITADTLDDMFLMQRIEVRWLLKDRPSGVCS